jgi:hypothetical protein
LGKRSDQSMTMNTLRGLGHCAPDPQAEDCQLN